MPDGTHSTSFWQPIYDRFLADKRTQAAFDISGLVLPELSRGQMTVIDKQ